MSRLRLTAAIPLIAACTGGPAEEAPPPPPGLTSDGALREHGAELFRKNCVLCHGERGDGQGVRHAYLRPSPPDFAGEAFQARATPAHVFATIRHGVGGSSMPAWPALTDAETWALTAHVLALAESR